MATELNPLPPTLTERKRYIIYDIISDSPKVLGDVVSAIWSSVLYVIGQKGAAKAGIWIVKDLFNEEMQRGAIKVNHTYIEDIRTALALISEVNQERTTIMVVGVTGTMKSARAKYFSALG